MANIKIDIEHKTKLSELIAAGHRHFGKVAPRKRYREDDDEGGAGGAAASPFERHPLLAEQPMGASSDLTAIVTDNDYAVEEGEKRSDEATPELRQKLSQSHTHSHVAQPGLH